MANLTTEATAYKAEVIDFKAAIRQAWEVADYDDFKQSLVNEAEALAERAIGIGDEALKQWEKSENIEAGIVNFLWSEKMKAILILWRDVLFQQHKAQVLVLDGQSEPSLLEQLKAASHSSLFGAAERLLGFYTSALQDIRRGRGGEQQQVERWRLQKNPWPVYREQIQKLADQCVELQKRHHELKEILRVYHSLFAWVQQHCRACEEDVVQFEKLTRSAVQLIEEQIEERPGKVASSLDELEAKVEIPKHLDTFLYQYETEFNQLNPISPVPIKVYQGQVQVRELNFKRSARQWLESEVLPLLYETWELTEKANNGVRMALVNVRNRVLIIANETKEGKPADLSQEEICQPLKAYLRNFEPYQDMLVELRETIAGRLSEHFRVSHVYMPERPFLPLPLQSTIKQLRAGRNELWELISRNFRQWTASIRQLTANVEQEESLSTSEKIARFVQTRMPSGNDNQQYSSIFLTKGYIGESFWVGREQELNHMESLISQWELGYRGAVCLTGQRFSGKTVFGEQVAHRYFPEHTVRIVPNAVIKVGGRKMTTDFRLGDALAFVRKHTLNTRTMVWIDDLELWGDNNAPVGENVRHLKKQIDAHSNQLFFVVSMSNWFKGLLQNTHEIDRIFQAEINLDRMSVKEVRQAILIRHGATHKVLVDEEGNEVTPPQFNRMTNRIYRVAEGNIGEALNLWSFTTRRGPGEQVVQSLGTQYPLPDFINPDIAVLLVTLLMEKRTNEYRLRKLLGPSFASKYRSMLQRLFSSGLLSRQMDGWIEINEVAANEVGRLLDRRQYIKFYH